MPIHDWTRVRSGLFHDFHQAWSIEIRNSLNRGSMPKGYYALVEQKVDGPEPDVIAVQSKVKRKSQTDTTVAVMDPPKTSVTTHISSDAARYARKANRITVRHPLGQVAVGRNRHHLIGRWGRTRPLPRHRRHGCRRRLVGQAGNAP